MLSMNGQFPLNTKLASHHAWCWRARILYSVDTRILGKETRTVLSPGRMRGLWFLHDRMNTDASEQECHDWKDSTASKHWSGHSRGDGATSKCSLTALTLDTITGTLAGFQEFLGGRLTCDHVWSTDWARIRTVESLTVQGVWNFSGHLRCKEDDGQKYKSSHHDALFTFVQLLTAEEIP